MTPSVAAASPAVAHAPLAVVSTVLPDREWWTEEAVRAGTDWSGVVGAALEMMIAAGIVEQAEPRTIIPWDAPSWREAAQKFRENPARAEPKRLAQLRRLMADDVSLERVWLELRDNHSKAFKKGNSR